MNAPAARVAVWRGGDRFEIESVPLPRPGVGEVLVRVDLATVCGSDHHTVAGRRPAPCPSVLGHEGVGVVVATGTAVGVRPGQRVVWSVAVSCGHCDRCTAGRTAKCRSVRKLGHEPYASDWRLAGSYASHVLLPAGAALVLVPDEVADCVAAPAGCATATVMAAAEAAGPMRGRRVLIGGAGMLGLTAAAFAVDAGAAEVIVFDRDRTRLELAARFGATATVMVGGAPNDLDDLGELGEVDVALDFSGASSAVSGSLDALGVGGRLVLVGSVAPGPPVPVDPERVVRSWLTITGVHNYEPRHLQQAVDFLACNERPWSSLVEAPVPLDQLDRVLSSPTRRPRAAVRA